MKTIYEKNILIAKFLGATTALKKDINCLYWSSENFKKLDGKLVFEYNLKFNENYRWLMDVVERIESIYDPHHGYFGVFISSNSCTIQGTNLRLDKIVNPPIYFNSVVLKTKFESIYEAIVAFIEWYMNKK